MESVTIFRMVMRVGNMARIDVKKIKREDKYRNTIHEEVESTYTIFEKNGVKYFQIDTYGKSERKLKGQSSQVLQLDEVSVYDLIKLLSEKF